MRRELASLIVLAFLLSVVEPLPAADIVVDIQHPAASDDTGDGSPEKPFKSIRAAFGRAAPGDTVLVMPGDYGAKMDLHKSGEKDKPIIVRSAVPREARIAGFDVAPWNRNNSFLRIEGFTFAPGETQGAGIDISLGDHIDIVGNRFIRCGIAGGRIRKGSEDVSQARHIRIAYNYMTDMAIAISIAGHDFTIESNEIFSLKLRGPGDADHARLFGIGHTVRYNYFHGTQPANIGKAHVDIVQFFDQNGDILRDLTVHDNVFFDFHQMFMATALKAEPHAANMTFTRNIASSPWGAWGVCAAGIPGVKVFNNTFHDIIWYGTGISRQRGEGVIQNNIYSKINQAVQINQGATAVCDHNLIFQAKPGDAGKDNLVDVDPKMIDPAGGNFRLAPDSPAIGAGVGKVAIGALDYPNVYYVDPRHPGAADDGFGYAGRPYRTIAAAMAVARKGETILLRGGTYREAIVPAATAAGVVIQPMKDQEPVVISGADLIAGWTKTGDMWSAPLAAKPTAVLCDGAPWTGFTYDEDKKQLVMTGAEDPRLHTFEAVVRERAIDLTNVRGLTIRNVRTAHTAGDPVASGEDNHITLE